MNLNITYVGGAANNTAPAGFYSAVSYVVNYYDTLFTNNVTVNIDVDYGKILNPNTNTFESLNSGDLGENFYTGFGTVSYAAVKNALVSQNAPGSSTLPSSSPEPTNYSFVMNSGEAKALGFLSGTAPALDGSAGFTSNVAWDFSPTTVPTANQYYLVGSIEHEFSEVMGRDSFLNASNQYFVMDLYRYAAPHVLQTGSGGPSYFSLNSGVTNLDNWNNFQTGNNGDLGDWAPSAGPDSYLDNSNPGVINPVTNTDIALMEALGWTSNYVAPTLTVQNVSVGESASIAATSFITLSNAAGDNIAQYTLEDTGTNGHFTVNGASQPDGQSFNVSSLSNVQYVGGSAPGSDTLKVKFFDSTTGSESTFTSFTATTTAPNLINNSITDLYIGYFNRAPDPAGETYWVGRLGSGMSLSAIAQSYSVQTESTNLYPFLASPNTASTAAVQAFVTSVYENLFNRAPDTAGENYWVTQLQTGASTVGGAIINIISGAQLNDLATINNKVIVGDYFNSQISFYNVQFSNSVAHSALSAVTSNVSSIATAEAIVNAYVATAPHATQAATTSQTEVNLVGISPNHDLAVAA